MTQTESMDKHLFGLKTRDQLMQAFRLYLECGGFPETISYDQSTREQTLQDYVTIVTYRDIIERYTVINHAVIKYMIVSMLRNVAKPF